MTTGRRRQHRPEKVAAKLSDACAKLNAGNNCEAVLQALARVARAACWEAACS